MKRQGNYRKGKPWQFFTHHEDRGYETPCLIWHGAKAPNGYGKIKRLDKTLIAHRYVWSQVIGEIQPGLEIDHKCNQRDCVNTDHMQLVDRGTNVRYIYERRKAA